MFKTVLALAFLLVVKVLASPLSRPTSLDEDQKVEPLQEPCVRQGGICSERNDCEPSNIASMDILCPKQSHLGIVCCYL